MGNQTRSKLVNCRNQRRTQPPKAATKPQFLMSQNIKLHQLVLMTISDHFVRMRIQRENPNFRAVGAVMGSQEGRDLHLLTGFEFVYEVNSSNEIEKVDLAYLKKKIEMMQQVFKSYDFLGWYSTCPDMKPYPGDIKIHKLMQDFNENPIYICVDPSKPMKVSSELALRVYELKYDNENFSRVDYSVDADKSETITVDFLNKNVTNKASSKFSDGLQTSISAVKNLRTRLQMLQQVLEKNEKVKKDPRLLRELNEIVNSYPTSLGADVEEQMLNEYYENALVGCLSTVTVANKTISEVINLKSAFSTAARADVDMIQRYWFQ
eukprot:TRINITY_DN11517_c0_g1_i3.p1 TRINITY_DN11517_c0_g1~~TRINITY_DN11517_c0_g1_i3.p1  ORF type:complete len:322 (-),score=56.18 TRINITY_DN11517_c0_g1_i3:159-1124(-)